MKAAILKAFGSPLAIETLPDPNLGTGEIIVDVVATPVLPYANEVFSGQRKYLLNVPVMPGTGAIGRVRSVGLTRRVSLPATGFSVIPLCGRATEDLLRTSPYKA